MNFVSKVKENPLLIFQVILIVLLILLAIVFVVVMCFENPKRIFNLLGVSEKDQPKYEVLKFLGIGMGGVLVALQALASHRRAKAMEDTAKTQVDAANAQADAANAQANAAQAQARANEHTEQGLRQERLKNAIEHLGHDSSSVRLGGAYELFHLAEDNKELRKTAFDMLCLHIRQTTGEYEYQNEHKSKPSEEVQSLLTLLFVQDHEIFKDLQINLQESWLNGANLQRARLEKAILTKTHLQGAKLAEAQLQEADLIEAHLQGAGLHKVQLSGANLMYACLQGAFLIGTRLQMAILDRAHLQGSYISVVSLQGASLYGAHLQGANISRIGLQEASLYEAYLQGTGSKNGFLGTPFADRIRGSIGQNKSIGDRRDMSKVVFEGGLSREGVNALVAGLSDEKATELREKLESHIGKPASNQLPKDSDAITGAYT